MTEKRKSEMGNGHFAVERERERERERELCQTAYLSYRRERSERVLLSQDFSVWVL